MADVFLSYAREDITIAERIEAALRERGWTVFRDRQLHGGLRFDEVISDELRSARCVVVLWSEASISSEWVIAEADDARKRDILVPVRLADVDPPLPFGLRNCVDLFGWQSKRTHPGFDHLVSSITRLAGAPATRAEIPPAYLDRLRETYAKVDLLGQEADKSRAFQLDHVYVPALTSAASRRDGATGAIVPESDAPRLVPLLRRLNDDSLYVLAQAGAGKSTFCRWAVLRSIAGEDCGHSVPTPDDFAEPSPDRLRGHLPLLIPFREFAARTDWGRGGRTWHRADLEGALAAWVDKTVEHLSGALLTAHLKAGTAFLLLDGIDELPESELRDRVTVYPRELVLSGLADALPTWRQAGNRILLTSRPAGMERARLHRLGLDAAPLEPLPEELQHLFVRRWFHTLRKEQQAEGLIDTIRERDDDLAPLAENPMLLTALCILYDGGGRVPEDRYKLYKRIVDNVLFNRFPGGTSETEPVKARLEAIALRMHEGEPAEPRSSPAAEVGELDVDQVLLEIADEGWCDEDRRVEPAIRRSQLLEKSGLLLTRAEQRVFFYHLSIQEYLAAERLLKSGVDVEAVIGERGAVPEWRPTLLFLFAGKSDGALPGWGSRLLGSLIKAQTRTEVKANPAPALFIAEAIDLILAKKRPLPAPVTDAFVRLVCDAIEDEVALPARQALGSTLGRVGDPRILNLRDPAAYVEVPGGSYRVGDKKKRRIEITAPFRIGRYPVTNGQYREFIEAGGYSERGRQWWSQRGWRWLKEENATEPLFWHGRRWNGPNQPVVGVSFWEAEACSAWAGGRLPSEQEWEAAARGPKGYAYPWGEDWQDGICNTGEAGLGVTSPVGLFPRSRQADLAIEDLAGNVWEWCASLYDPAEKDDSSARVLRGGSWGDGRGGARSAYRNRNHPNNRNNNIGFRMVCSSPILDH